MCASSDIVLADQVANNPHLVTAGELDDTLLEILARVDNSMIAAM
jgi:hypothetical protein